jgi:DNA invertase Pin-like site-specific DNA recombinase
MWYMRVYGYARVSTIDQSLDIQLEKIRELCKLRDYELIQLFSEKASGKNIPGREQLMDMLDLLKVNPMAIDAVVVYKLDRLGRSITDLINIVKFLQDHKIQLISITDNIDTSSSQGRLFFYFMGAIAEFERELIHERTMAGIIKARQDGKKFGRRRKVIDLEDVKKKMAAGVPKTKICKELKVSYSFLNKKLFDERVRT